MMNDASKLPHLPLAPKKGTLAIIYETNKFKQPQSVKIIRHLPFDERSKEEMLHDWDLL